MPRLLFLLLFFSLRAACTSAQSLTVSDLVTLSSVPSKNISSYLNKKGFLPEPKASYDDTMTLRFFEKKRTKRNVTQSINREVDLYRKENVDYFVLRSTSLKEYQDGYNWLKKGGFFSASKKDTSFSAPVLFQKNNITIQATRTNERGSPEFTFLLQKKELPKADDVQYGDDLLQFNSHEFLVAFFGSKSVKGMFIIFRNMN